MLILKVFHIRCTRFCMEIAILAYNDLLEKGVFMSWCIYDWKHVTRCIPGPPFGLNHYLFPRFGGIGGPKKIIWDSRKKTERFEGKICRVWTTCWAPVDSMEGRGDPVGVVDEPPNHWRASGGSGLGMCRGDCDWQSVSGTFDSVDSPGAIETTNGEKGAQVLMPIQSEWHLVWTRFLTRSLRFVRQPPSEP